MAGKDDVRGRVCVREPAEDVALLKREEARAGGGQRRRVGVGVGVGGGQRLCLVQDGRRDVYADRGALAGEPGQAGGDCARAAANIENVVCLFDVRQEEGGFRLGRSLLLGACGVVRVALHVPVVIMLRHG